MRIFENSLANESGGVAALKGDVPSSSLPSRKLPSWLVGVLVIVGLILLVAGAWALWIEKQALSSRLDEADRHVGQTEEQINSLLGDMGRARIQLMNAHQDASRATEEAAATASVRSQVEQERSSANEQSQAARAQANEARTAATEAEEQKKQIREERMAEMNRLQVAMAKIVKTTPATWGMTADIGRAQNLFHDDTDKLEDSGRETLSRLAGVFLGSHGYRISLSLVHPGKNREESALLQQRLIAVTKYLMDAGVPGEILSTKAASTADKKVPDSVWLQVQVVDTILPENRSISESITGSDQPVPLTAKKSTRGL